MFDVIDMRSGRVFAREKALVKRRAQRYGWIILEEGLGSRSRNNVVGLVDNWLLGHFEKGWGMKDAIEGKGGEED